MQKDMIGYVRNGRKTIDQILAAFSKGHIQDALNIISLMDKHNITKEDIKSFLETSLVETNKPIKTRRLSKEQRVDMLARTKWGYKRR